MNLSGTFNVFRLIISPTLCLPHHTISTFNQLPIPLSKAFEEKDGGKRTDIRAVILDKDNCFARPHENEVYGPYKLRQIVKSGCFNLGINLLTDTLKDKFQELREAYPGSSLLIVSNTSGTQSDVGNAQAEMLEQNTGVRVLRHSTKKPGCREEIFEYFRGATDVEITSPAQIAVVGDRLFTDVMMANLMGSRAIWVKDGVVPATSVFTSIEKKVAAFLFRRGYQAPDPKSDFE